MLGTPKNGNITQSMQYPAVETVHTQWPALQCLAQVRSHLRGLMKLLNGIGSMALQFHKNGVWKECGLNWLCQKVP